MESLYITNSIVTERSTALTVYSSMHACEESYGDWTLWQWFYGYAEVRNFAAPNTLIEESSKKVLHFSLFRTIDGSKKTLQKFLTRSEEPFWFSIQPENSLVKGSLVFTVPVYTPCFYLK